MILIIFLFLQVSVPISSSSETPTPAASAPTVASSHSEKGNATPSESREPRVQKVNDHVLRAKQNSTGEKKPASKSIGNFENNG